MVTTDQIRILLSEGKPRLLAELLISVDPQERPKLCRPLVKQAKAISGVSHGSSVKSWMKELHAAHLDGHEYPGGHEQFIDAWNGKISDTHWDAATTVLLASKTPAQAAKVWPIPANDEFTQWLYPALFPHDLAIFTEQWSADFATNPKHWDRNRDRTVMYEWIEQGLAPPPTHDGAVLMCIEVTGMTSNGRLLSWLVQHPIVTETIFKRIFSTPGVKGASLAQSDQTDPDEPIRTSVIPMLMKKGIWTREFVEQGVRSAISSDLPPYQLRWFKRLANDLGVLPLASASRFR